MGPAEGDAGRVLSQMSYEAPGRPTVADQVFDQLHRQILSLELAPGTKMSEAEVASAFGFSRQPVRDAFYRLAKLGFLTIRPQRGTQVSWISETQVMQARFIRAAIEAEIVRVACDRLTNEDFDALDEVLRRQNEANEAGDALAFHTLDDLFHREISIRSGHGYVWELIRETKAHMDRVRFLSLAFASEAAYGEHLEIMAALRARDRDRAAAELHRHLSRIVVQIGRIRAENERFFADEPADA